MYKQKLFRIANVGIRAIGLGSKFVLILGLARMLEPEEVGQYGLFVSVVSFSALILGGDYYTYCQRELLSVDRTNWSFVIQHQLLGVCLLYVVLLPLQLLWFLSGYLSSTIIVWFYLILIAEHLSSEINRLLIVINKPVFASGILFVRFGLWVWIVLPLMWFFPVTQNLEFVYIAWLFGATLAIVLGGRIIWREVPMWKRWPIDRRWIGKGLQVGLIFLSATMCLKALTTVDRYIVGYFAGPELLGVYVVYIGMVMAIVNFLDAAVFSFLYPRLVSACKQGDDENYYKVMKELIWSAIVFGLFLVACVAIMAPYVLEWTGHALYLDHLPLLWLLLIFSFTYCISMVPHFGLYAHGDDRGIVIAHISSLIVFALTITLLANHMPLESAAIGLIGAFFWMGVYKIYRYCKLEKTEFDKKSILLS